MTEAPLTPEEEDIALAGEYVLGLLPADEVRKVQNKISTDTRFAQLVTGWEAHFTEMADEIEAVAPRAALKKALISKVFPEPQPSLWERLGFWRWLAPIAIVIGAVAFVMQPDRVLQTPNYMAELIASDGSVTVTASYFKETQDVLVEITDGAAPNGRVLQVWGILERQAPVPIGVIPANGSGRFAVPEELKGKFAGLICAISEEPPGGSPTGLPTGEVLATAELRQL